MLAIDPGLRKPAFAIIHVFPNAKKVGSIRTIAMNNDKLDYPEALARIYDKLDALMEEYKPRDIVAERMFTIRNTETQQLFRTVGCMELCAHRRKKKIYTITPKEVKKFITNNGSATKNEVREAIQARYPNKRFKTTDESDAVAIGLSYLMERKHIKPYFEPEPKPPRKKKSN